MEAAASEAHADATHADATHADATHADATHADATHTTAFADGARRGPPPDLRPFVAGYSGYRLVGPPGTHRGLPSPHLTLILTLDEPLVVAAHPDPAQRADVFDALVGGLHQRPATITHPGRQAGIQVALRPLGARALLGAPAAALAGIDVHLGDVVTDGWVERVRGRLLAAPTWPARFAVLDDALRRRLGAVEWPAEVRHAWGRLVAPPTRQAAPGGPGRQAGQGRRIADLAAELGWSERRLHDRFRGEIGLAPSQVARIARFDRARRALFARTAAGAPPRLAEFAVAQGYYDQAHLAREFRELAGCPPSRLLAEELRFVQALPDDDDAGWEA